MKKSTGFLTTLIHFFIKLLDFFTHSSAKKEEELRIQKINELKTELKQALAEGRITDAQSIHIQLVKLTFLTLLCIITLSGCITAPPSTTFVIIGERINTVQPKQTIVIPPLKPPAQQWYLVDDVGLYQWLNINAKQPHKD